MRSPRRWRWQATATANDASAALARRHPLTRTRYRGRSESSRAKTGFESGHPTAGARNGSAETVARRYSGEIWPMPIRSEFGWVLSTLIRASAPAFASSSAPPQPGSESQPMDCLATPRAAIPGQATAMSPWFSDDRDPRRGSSARRATRRRPQACIAATRRPLRFPPAARPRTRRQPNFRANSAGAI